MKAPVDKDAYFLSIFFYFFFQSMITLVESIYTLDLLNTQLDEKALGLLFFFSPVFLYLTKDEHSRKILYGSGIVTVIFKLLYPLFNPTLKLLFAGIALGAALIFLVMYFRLKSRETGFSANIVLSLLVGTLIGIFFRTLYSTLDLTEYGYYQLIGVSLGIIAIIQLRGLQFDEFEEESEKGRHPFFSILGIFSIITLLYLAYGSPVVFTRWTEADYILIITVSVLSFGSYLLAQIRYPEIIARITRKQFLIANIVFAISLIGTILLHQSKFIKVYGDNMVLVDKTPGYMQIAIILNILLSPVLFLNLSVFVKNLKESNASKNKLVSAFLLNGLIIVILVFMFIFTNVWGYVKPVSPAFRGLFWFPFTISLLIILLLILKMFTPKNILLHVEEVWSRKSSILIFSVLIIGTVGAAIYLTPSPNGIATGNTLTVMTFNIQQGVNETGDKNYQNQLELIREINPDIIGLQESDTPKINTGNSDIVKFFADGLGYYSYYGPKSIMQTYGVALLSRYPILDVQTIYTYGNKDEIGSIYAQIQVNSAIVNVFINHPAGSDESKLHHTETMLEMANGLSNVILLGDFNWRQYTVYYNMTTALYVDTWRAIYPNGIDDNNLNMSSSIDHVFVSKSFGIIDATYIPSPASQTDHPVYYTKISY